MAEEEPRKVDADEPLTDADSDEPLLYSILPLVRAARAKALDVEIDAIIDKVSRDE